MKELLDKLLQRHKYLEPTAEEELRRQVNVLYGAFTGLIGSEKMVLRASKYSALSYIHSEDPRQRLVGLQRLIYEDVSYDKVPGDDEVINVLNELEMVLAEMLARQAVEERLEKKITQRMDEKQQEYVREIKMELIKEELHDVETQQTKRKLKELDDLEKVELTESVMERVRPKRLSAIVGQERAVEAMQSKLASVYPQHLLLYGPPGVGKTTAARIVLDEAKKLAFTPFGPKAPFVETDGTTLRWDSRDMTNPLIGSVHDPIYQGARRDLADTGIPEPKPGLVTEAHGGILFIDEIGEMDPMLLNKLLKVMEDKRVRFESAYYDEDDPNVPQYIRRLFAEGHRRTSFSSEPRRETRRKSIRPFARAVQKSFLNPSFRRTSKKSFLMQRNNWGHPLKTASLNLLPNLPLKGEKPSTFWPIPTDWPYSSREIKIRYALPRTMSAASPRSAASFPM